MGKRFKVKNMYIIAQVEAFDDETGVSENNFIDMLNLIENRKAIAPTKSTAEPANKSYEEIEQNTTIRPRKKPQRLKVPIDGVDRDMYYVGREYDPTLDEKKAYNKVWRILDRDFKLPDNSYDLKGFGKYMTKEIRKAKSKRQTERSFY